MVATDKKNKKEQKSLFQSAREEARILYERAVRDAPPHGVVGFQSQPDGKGSKSAVPRLFEDMPICSMTMSGLERGGFLRMTRIQQLSLPHSLAGRDILGAARTGSGKTLAFVIPLFEKLCREGWTSGIGVGAIIISPTRELALQIFEVVKAVGYRHSVVAGLVIGGSNFSQEQTYLHQIGVMVCTPGRLLQHLEQTPNFDTSGLQVLVLDEADRLLDLGFKDQLTQIVKYIPNERQTMLFSATQTKSVKALASISLKNPEHISVVHSEITDSAEVGANTRKPNPTPQSLMQAYTVCQLPEKLDVLYSFVRSHLRSKTIVFFSSCKQVKFVSEAFRMLRPGIPLACLHGKIKQQKRMMVYQDFIKKPAVVLFATDIAARGLDFPNVDWVVQVDCPEDVSGYIHRVGRTARYKNRGKALLLLLPNEAPNMVSLLRKANIPLLEKSMNPSKQQSIQKKLQGLVAGNQELKLNAQRAVKSYVRSVYLQPDSRVFDVSKIPIKAYSQSLGLMAAPRIKNISGIGGEASRSEHREKKNAPHSVVKLNAMIEENKSDQNPDDFVDSDDVLELVEKLKSSRRNKGKKTKVERLLALKASGPVAQAQTMKASESDSELSDDEGLVFVGSQKPIEDDSGVQLDDKESALTDDFERKSKLPSKKQLSRMKISKDGLVKGRAKSSRRTFDDEGNECEAFARIGEPSVTGGDDTVYVSKDAREDYLESVRLNLQKEDAEDKLREKERVKQKRREIKQKLREQRNKDRSENEEYGVQLASSSDTDLHELDVTESDQIHTKSGDKSSNVDDSPKVNRALKRQKRGIESIEKEALRLIDSMKASS